MKTVCQVCMHHCQLEEGQYGICRARKNQGGHIICENYGQVTSFALDPIEKKPLRAFHPGSVIFSVGSYGCNLRWPCCQTYEISMEGEEEADTLYFSPQDLTDKAREYQNVGNIGVAYTYNEPLVVYEYVLDTSQLVKKAGMVNVLVTNGSADQKILKELLPYIDAMNIDLKGFTPEYYRKLGGDLETVKAFIQYAASNCHVELTTLVVQGENDSIGEMEKEAQWIASIDKDIPLHVTRFFPNYHMTDRAATRVNKVCELAETARKYLEHVFVGNC